MKCDVCKKEYSPDCDFQQGRCPHHKPMINIQPKDPSKGHFYVSLVKSALRIVAVVALLQGGGVFFVAGFFLIGAELLGILEELV